MKLYSLILSFLFGLTFSYGQSTDSLFALNRKDTVRFKCGPPIVQALIIGEGLIVAMSYYASKPSVYGDKITGGIYAAGSVAMLAYIPFYWTDKEAKKKKFRKDRIYVSATMLAMSYGFSRIATYNLLQAEGQDFEQRFVRNLIENQAAYLIPVGLGFLTKKILFRKEFLSKAQKNLMFNGHSIGLTMIF